MGIKLWLPSRLYGIAKRKLVYEVKGKTVGECVDHLVRVIPEIKKALFYKAGETLHPYVKVRVNEESADAEGLAKKVKEGDEIHLMMNMS
ncbi:MAG: MoaD/ThiS family protein [Pseudomonadota bacterium]